MLKISVNNLLPGMVVAKNIYDADANLLLSKDMILTVQYINRLKTIGIRSIYIFTEKSEKEGNIILDYTSGLLKYPDKKEAVKWKKKL